jgi:hypothetical protein
MSPREGYPCHKMSLLHMEAWGNLRAHVTIAPSTVLIPKGFSEMCLKNHHLSGVVVVSMLLVGGQARRS